jgi:hypothetical protein
MRSLLITSACASAGRDAPHAHRDHSATNPKTRAGLALLLAAMLSACATTNSDPYPDFERLAIRAQQPSPGDETAAVDSTGKLIATGAAVGASSVLVTGLLTSLLCGPYFAVCFAGTGAAALGGAAAGAVVGGSVSLTAEEKERVNGRLENLQRERNLSEDLADSLSARLPAERLTVPDTADAQLILEVQGWRAASGFEDTISIGIAVKATLEWELDKAESRDTSRGFICWTEPAPLEDWLDSDDTPPAQELSHCIDDLAVQIWTALKASGDDAETDSGPQIGFGQYDPAAGDW